MFKKSPKDHIDEIMTRRLVTASLTSSIRTAYQIMQEHNIRHLPIEDADGRIVGILSDRDVHRAMKPRPDAAPGEHDIEFASLAETQDFMSWPVRSVPINSTAYEVTQIMIREKISAVLVNDSHGRPKGIVTSEDLMKLLLRVLEKSPNDIHLDMSFLLDDFASGGYMV